MPLPQCDWGLKFHPCVRHTLFFLFKGVVMGVGLKNHKSQILNFFLLWPWWEEKCFHIVAIKMAGRKKIFTICVSAKNIFFTDYIIPGLPQHEKQMKRVCVPDTKCNQLSLPGVNVKLFFFQNSPIFQGGNIKRRRNLYQKVNWPDSNIPFNTPH